MFLQEIKEINRDLLKETIVAMYGENVADLLINRMENDEISNLLGKLAAEISDVAMNKLNNNEMKKFIKNSAKPYQHTVFNEMLNDYIKNITD